MKNGIAFLMLGLFWACQKPPDEGDYLVMESEPIRKSEILMSEITTNVQIIPLETSEKVSSKRLKRSSKKEGFIIYKTEASDCWFSMPMGNI